MVARDTSTVRSRTGIYTSSCRPTHLSLEERDISCTSRAKKPKPAEPSDDEIRDRLLRFLYATYKSARSADAIYQTMGEIKKAMKTLKVMEKRIVSNLTYLIQNEWVEQDVRQFIVQPRGKPVMTRQIRYRVSSAAVNRYEGPSAFQRAEKMAGINITNIQGVTVVGHDNVVNTQFADLYRNLDLLGSEVRANEQLNDREKLSYQAEIETIKSQLMKEEPDRSIVERSWEVLKGVATLSGVAAAGDRVRLLLHGLFGIG